MTTSLRGVLRAVAWLLFGAWLFAATRAHAATPPRGVTIAPRPTWVEPPPARATRMPESSNGVAALLVDFQTRYVGGERTAYFSGALAVTGDAGASSVGERSFRFTPPHERLVLHAIQVRRGDVASSKLDASRIQLIQREAELEHSVYSGTQTAVVVIPDLRVGDVLEYEFSIVGSNPVLAGHFFEQWQLALPFEVGVMRHRTVTDRAPYFKAFGHGADPPLALAAGGVHTVRWEKRDVAARRDEADVPPEVDTSPWVEVTDVAEWKEIAAWGGALFQPDVAAVRAVADPIAAASDDPEARTLAALRRVQDDIRYLSLAFAESSHRPAAPRSVLVRRYGDCKDKALLLVSILEALGIDADVALVSSSGGRKLSETLPAIAFDHVIVTATIAGRRWWLDPTRTFQRGTLADVSVRGFAHALVLDPATTSLVAIEEPTHTVPDVSADLRYQLDAWGGPIDLTVEVTFGNQLAESTRSSHATLPAEDFARQLSEFVAKSHPEAKRAGAASYRDQEDVNRVTLTQRFDVGAKAWDEEGGRVQLSIFPMFLSSLLPSISPDRAQPLLLPHPTWIEHTVRMLTPEEISFVDGQASWSSIVGELSWRNARQGKEVTSWTRYRSLARRLEASELSQLQETGSEVEKLATIAVWNQVAAPDGASTFPLPLFGVLLAVWALVALAGVVAMHRFLPELSRHAVRYDPSLAGRGGWLVLVGLGVTLQPLLLLGTSINEGRNLFTDATWGLMTTPGTDAYRPGWAVVVLVETGAQVLLFFMAVWTAIAFWRTSRRFPLAYVAVTVVATATFVIDQALLRAIELPVEPGHTASAIRDIVVRGAWTLYVLSSKRVKATFTPPLPEAPRRKKKRKRAAPPDLLNTDGDAGHT